MRKDNSLIMGNLMPENQETIGKLAEIQRTKSQIENIDQEVEAMNSMLRKTVQLSEDDDFQLMVDKILAYETIEALKAATKEQIDEILTDSQGKNITFYGAKKMSDAEMEDLRRDYVEFVFNSEIEMKRLDEARADLDAEWLNMDDEFKSIYESLGGDMTKYVSGLLQETQEALESKDDLTPEDKERLSAIAKVRSSLDQAVKLDNVIEYVDAFDARNILNDYSRRSEDIGTRYAKATKKVNLSISLLAFKNIERLFIKSERLHQHGDLFTFIVMRYISYKKDINAYDGIFLSQLAYELRQLYTKDPAKLTDDEATRRNLLLANIERVLTVVYNKLGL